MIATARPDGPNPFPSPGTQDTPSTSTHALPTSAPPPSSTLESFTAWAHPSGGQPLPSAAPSRPASPRLHSLPDNANPLGLLAEASLSSSRNKRRTEELESESATSVLPGIADPRYFMPGAISILPLRRFVIENKMAPALLSERIVTPEEVVEVRCSLSLFVRPADVRRTAL